MAPRCNPRYGGAVTGAVHDLLLIHYNEVALKLGHRSMFVGRLVENIRRALHGLDVGPVESTAGRLILHPGAAPFEEVIERLEVIPGIRQILSTQEPGNRVEDRRAHRRRHPGTRRFEEARFRRLRDRGRGSYLSWHGGEDPGLRWTSGFDRRSCGAVAVRRDRFAGRRLAHDAPRVPSGRGPLPQHAVSRRNQSAQG